MITLNGVKEELNGKMLVSDFIFNKQIEQNGVVVLVNDEIIGRDDWNKTYISDGQQVEVVSFVGGG